MIDSPSRLRLIRKASALTRIFPIHEGRVSVNSRIRIVTITIMKGIRVQIPNEGSWWTCGPIAIPAQVAISPLQLRAYFESTGPTRTLINSRGIVNLTFWLKRQPATLQFAQTSKMYLNRGCPIFLMRLFLILLHALFQGSLKRNRKCFFSPSSK